jgi:hypothetical protein
MSNAEAVVSIVTIVGLIFLFCWFVYFMARSESSDSGKLRKHETRLTPCMWETTTWYEPLTKENVEAAMTQKGKAADAATSERSDEHASE